MTIGIPIWVEPQNFKYIAGLHTDIKYNVKIDMQGTVVIGAYCEIADEVIIYSHTHLFKYADWQKRPIQSLITQIGDSVFIGARSIILGGVSIADHCIVGAGSVVTKSITEPYTIWAGNPAKQIGVVQHDPT